MAFINDDALLAMASSFLVPIPESAKRTLRRVEVQAREQEDGSRLWAIVQGGSTLARDGLWEIESHASSKDEGYLERCRWQDPRTAIAFFMAHLKAHPTGYLPEHL